MRRITLRDIARELDMNESTVSYALAGKGSIGEKTRQLVRETAERMGYVPNQAARQISMGKSAMIAIVVPNVLAEYNSLVKEWFDISISNDEADAIGIGKYVAEVLNKNVVTYNWEI